MKTAERLNGRRTRRTGKPHSIDDGTSVATRIRGRRVARAAAQACRYQGRAMLICGACVRELPEGAYSEEQRVRRQSCRRCEECVVSGNQLVLMKKGRKRSEADDCPICQLPLPLDKSRTTFKSCCMKLVCNGCILAAVKRGMRDCPFCRTPRPKEDSQVLAMVQKRVAVGDPMAIYHLGDKYVVGHK